MTERPIDILLVEDNPDDATLTLHSLARHRLSNRIQTARDGEEALDFLFRKGAWANRDEAPLKLVLLDLKLPKVSGLQVLRQVKSHPGTSSIPVVVLTSSREDSDIKTAYQLGANSYIVKPVDFGNFSEAVREVGLYWLLLNEPLVRA